MSEAKTWNLRGGMGVIIGFVVPFAAILTSVVVFDLDDPQAEKEVNAQEAALGEERPQAGQDVEWWGQEVSRFRLERSRIDRQIDHLERAFNDYQARVAGNDLPAVEIEWEAQGRCDDGVCTTTYPAAEKRWALLMDEARAASASELSQRHASELKDLSGRVDDLGRLMRQSISDHHEMRGLLAYYGIDPETGEIQTDLEDDRKNPWVRRAKSLEAENARLKEALDAADVEMDASHQP